MAKKIIIVKKQKKQKAPTPAVVAEVGKVVKANKGKTKANTTPSAQAVVKTVHKKKAVVDWSIIRQRYITDPKSTTRSLAEEFDLSTSAIGKHCKKEKWTELRRKYIKKTEDNTIAAAGEDREQVINNLTKKHSDLLGKMSERLGQAVDRLNKDEWEAKNLEALAKATKLVIEGERLTVGLPSDVKGLSDPRGDKLNVTIESLHEKAKEVLHGKDNG